MACLVAETAAIHGLTPDEVRGRGRARPLVRARQHAMALMRDVRRPNGKPRYSLPQIARFFGLAAHTSVLHAVRAHTRRGAGTSDAGAEA